VLWTRSVPGAKTRKHDFNTLATSTPATDGERVYALFWDGKGLSLHAYDMKGTPVWDRDLGPLKIDHGAGASPVVVGGKVILANEQDGSSHLLALDAKTGKPLWDTPRKPFRASFATPFVLERSGEEPELVVASTAGVAGYDPDSGAEKWSWEIKFDGKVLRAVGSPVAGSGLVFATTGDGGGARHAVALRPGGKDGKPSLAWENKKSLPYVPTLLTRGDHVYFVNDRGGQAGCLAAKTGEIVWTGRLGGNMTASPILVDGKVYATSEDGNVYVFAADPAAFKLLAKNTVGEPVMATPAVADGRLFIRGKDHLFCFGRSAR
jgi:outer membrane protein assembly factor BamB